MYRMKPEVPTIPPIPGTRKMFVGAICLPKRRNPKKRIWATEEIARFELLVILKSDDTKPLRARVQAANELKRWMDELPLQRIEGLVLLAQNKTKRASVQVEANIALLRLTCGESPELVCTIFRDFYDQVACAKCGKGVNEEAHSGDYPGLYCRACCPGCSLLPHERLVEVKMNSTLEELASGPLPAREIVNVVRKDPWNTSSRVN